MIFKWENEEDRLRKYIRMSPRKKLEWLNRMNEFILKFSSKRTRAIRQKLRESR